MMAATPALSSAPSSVVPSVVIIVCPLYRTIPETQRIQVQVLSLFKGSDSRRNPGRFAGYFISRGIGRSVHVGDESHSRNICGSIRRDRHNVPEFIQVGIGNVPIFSTRQGSSKANCLPCWAVFGTWDQAVSKGHVS